MQVVLVESSELRLRLKAEAVPKSQFYAPRLKTLALAFTIVVEAIGKLHIKKPPVRMVFTMELFCNILRNNS